MRVDEVLISAFSDGRLPPLGYSRGGIQVARFGGLAES
jgi:hypothetical protein